MPFNHFIATNATGISIASRKNGSWSIEKFLDGQRINCLYAHPTRRGTVYAGIEEGILRSDDSGQTWHELGLTTENIRSIAVSCAAPDRIVVGTRPPKIFISNDHGRIWGEQAGFHKRVQWWWFTPAETPITDPYVQGLGVSPTNPDIIVAGMEFGATIRSEDAGKTWSKHLKNADRDCHFLCFHARDGNWVYEGGGGGAHFSSDAGKTWQAVSPISLWTYFRESMGKASSTDGLDRHYGWAIAADPEKPDIFYFSTSFSPARAHSHDGNAQAYIFRYKDGLVEKLTNGLPSPLPYMPYALITDIEQTGHIYAGMANGDVWYSTDYGESWQQMPLNVESIYRQMVAF